MFNQIKVGTKLIAGFLMLTCVSIAIGVIGISNMHQINKANTVLDETVARPLNNMAVISTHFQRGRGDMKDMIRANEAGQIATLKEKLSARIKQVDETMSALEKANISEDDRKIVAVLKSNLIDYRRSESEIVRLAQINQDEAAYVVLDGENNTTRYVVQQAIEDMLDLQAKEAVEIVEVNNKLSQTASNIMLLIIICGAIVSAFLGIGLTLSITRPLKSSVDMLGEIGKGHLNARLNLKRKDEVGQLADFMDRFADELQNNVIGTMKKIADGDLTAEITVKDRDDEISPALKTTIESLRELVAEARMLTRATLEGRLTTRGNVDKFRGGYREIIQGVNNTLDAVITPLNMAAANIDRISKGDIPPKNTDSYNGDFNTIKNNLNTCIDTLRSLLIEDGGGTLQEAANKNLSARVRIQYQGSFDTMKNNINNMLENMDKSMQQVAVGAEQVSSASIQISTGGQNLSQGASEQASSLEEVTSSLQEMSSMTRQNAANAKEARNVAEMTKSSADKGVGSMSQLSDAINKIRQSAASTAKIVKTIDEIAFQTNLLALNAAVEAARAGDAGKGFAVVAEEVRNLAMRSAEAAKNTANLIEESVKSAETGVAYNAEVTRNLQEINERAVKVSEVVAEIAAASEQQDVGIQQVNKAIEQMNQVVQQNAANAEESAGAAEEMSSQAEELRSMVAGFKLSVTNEFAQALRTGSQAGKLLHTTGAQKRVMTGAPLQGLDPKKVIPLDEKDRDVLRKF